MDSSTHTCTCVCGLVSTPNHFAGQGWRAAGNNAPSPDLTCAVVCHICRGCRGEDPRFAPRRHIEAVKPTPHTMHVPRVRYPLPGSTRTPRRQHARAAHEHTRDAALKLCFRRDQLGKLLADFAQLLRPVTPCQQQASTNPSGGGDRLGIQR